MWIEVRRACEAVQNFADIEDAAACAELIKEIEKYKWKLQNILKNQVDSYVSPQSGFLSIRAALGVPFSILYFFIMVSANSFGHMKFLLPY